MQTIHFSINQTFAVLLISDTNFVFSDQDLVLLQGHVPGITLLSSQPNHIDFTIEHIQSNQKNVQELKDRIIIHDDWPETFSGDVAHLLYGIVRRLYITKKQYPVHGACVQITTDGAQKNVLLVGHSGAGKTSVTVELLQDQSTKLFSGNKTVVSFVDGCVVATAGTPTITVRKEDFALCAEIEKEAVFEHWGRPTFLLPSERYVQNASVSIDVIAIVKLTTYTESCAELSYPGVVHTLYPYVLDTVHADIVMADFNAVLPGDVDVAAKNYAVEQVGKSVASIPVYTMVGSTAYIARKLTSL